MAKASEKVSKQQWDTNNNVKKRYPKVNLPGNIKSMCVGDRQFRMIMVDACHQGAEAKRIHAKQANKQIAAAMAADASE